MDDKLIETAVGAIVGALAKAAAEPVFGAGRAAWGWLCGKLPAEDAGVAQTIEAAPERVSARSKLTGLLQDVLERDPDGEITLRRLLGGEEGMRAIEQSLAVTGDNNKIAQVAGDKNRIAIG